MGKYWQFLYECIKWAYGRWQGKEPILTSIISLVFTILGIFGSILTPSWWIVLIPLVIMIMFVAPYKLWKSNNDKLTILTSKKLVVSLPDPDIRSSSNDLTGAYSQEWYRVKVHNPSSLPISSCYGKLIDFKSKLPYPNLPPLGIMFPWSSYSGVGKLTTIAGNDSDYIDIFVLLERCIPLVILDDSNGKRDLSQYPLPIDEYELTIQFGSKDEAFAPSYLKISIKPCLVNFKEKIVVTALNYNPDCLSRLS